MRLNNCHSGVREKFSVFSGERSDEERIGKDGARTSSSERFFPGFQNQTQLSPFYHAADLLVLPSREGEPWGLVVNEALHHGLPCLVSEAVGCAPDLIENGITGMVFETCSSQSLAAVLQQVFKFIRRDDVRWNCKQKVSGYSVENAAKGIAEAYWREVGNVRERE